MNIVLVYVRTYHGSWTNMCWTNGISAKRQENSSTGKIIIDPAR